MAVKSIGTSANRDYTTLAAWASYVNALALTEPEYGQCYNDALMATSATITLGGWTGSTSTRQVILECAYGESFSTHPNRGNNPLRCRQGNGFMFRSSLNSAASINITGSNFVMDGLQIHADKTHNHVINATTASNLIVRRCFIDGLAASDQLHVSAATIENSIILSRNGGGSENNQGIIRNCTYVSPPGFNVGSGIVTQGGIIQNTVSFGFFAPNGDFSGSANSLSTNNACCAASFNPAWVNFGTNGVTGVSGGDFISVSDTSGADDWRLSFRSKLRNAGVSAGGDTRMDIFYTPRV